MSCRPQIWPDSAGRFLKCFNCGYLLWDSEDREKKFNPYTVYVILYCNRNSEHLITNNSQIKYPDGKVCFWLIQSIKDLTY